MTMSVYCLTMYVMSFSLHTSSGAGGSSKLCHMQDDNAT
jgi:hypothetical protein